MQHSDLDLGDLRKVEARGSLRGAQRVAWTGFAIILILAVLGFTGSGGVFARTIMTSGHTELDVPRVMRRQASQELVLRITDAGSHRIDVLVPSSLLEIAAFEESAPAPSRSEAGAEGLRLEFDHATSDFVIRMRIRPENAAWPATYILTVEQERLAFSSLVLP